MASNPFIVNENKLERPKNQMIKENVFIVTYLMLIEMKYSYSKNPPKSDNEAAKRELDKWNTMMSWLKNNNTPFKEQVNAKLLAIMQQYDRLDNKGRIDAYESSLLSKIMPSIINYPHSLKTALDIYRRKQEFVGTDFYKLLDTLFPNNTVKFEQRNREVVENARNAVDHILNLFNSKNYDKEHYNKKPPEKTNVLSWFDEFDEDEFYEENSKE